jgi:hypothetical protein
MSEIVSSDRSNSENKTMKKRETMAGRMSVSALIHAATMAKVGIPTTRSELACLWLCSLILAALSSFSRTFHVQTPILRAFVPTTCDPRNANRKSAFRSKCT